MIDRHVLLLPDAVGPVGSLALNGRLPPWVEVDHVVGAGEVESESARLEAPQIRVCGSDFSQEVQPPVGDT